MVLYFLLIFSIYFLFMGLLLFGWAKARRQKLVKIPQEGLEVSVVIAVRNEAENINRLLGCLDAQRFPKSQFEVLIVDDDSTDDTVHKIGEFRKRSGLNIKLLTMKHSMENLHAPKKAALSTGIQAARGSIILATDGDTWFGPDWIGEMVAPFGQDNVHFVSGPVVLQDNSTFFRRMQALEFASIIGTGAALIGLQYPLMCNGANLASRKSTFEEVGGYTGNQNDASGDDVYLMQKIHVAFPGSVVFSNSSGSIVHTRPQKSWNNFISQRRRWASKWNRYLLKFSWLLPVFLFVHYATLLTSFIVMAVIPTTLVPLSALLIIKIILDTIFLKKVMVFSKLPFNLATVLIAGLIYPFYALLIGSLVHFGNYTWKGRSFKH